MSDKTSLTIAPSPEGSLNRYLQEIRKFPILEAQEEYQLAKDYADNGNVKSAHKLVTSHLRLVAKIAMGYRGYGLPVGEVISEGNVGLMQAVRKFDPERGFRLATYAMWWIRASIQEYILRSWSLVKIGTTAAQKKLFFNLRRLKGEMQDIDSGQLDPTQLADIAERLNVSTDDVRMMEGRMTTGGDQSLNAPIRASEEGDEWQDWIADERDDPESELLQSDEHEARMALLNQALSVLNERERDIFRARRLEEPVKTLEELSTEYDISRERVRQIEQRAFEKIRNAIQAASDTQSTDIDTADGKIVEGQAQLVNDRPS